MNNLENVVIFLETAVESLRGQRDTLLDIIEELRDELEETQDYIDWLREDDNLCA